MLVVRLVINVVVFVIVYCGNVRQPLGREESELLAISSRRRFQLSIRSRKHDLR